MSVDAAKKHVALEKEKYLKEQDRKNKKSSVNTPNITNIPVSPLDHNGNWEYLLPQSFSSTSSAKLNSLLVESNSSIVVNSPYSSCFYFVL